jgi:hypothetical protein
MRSIRRIFTIILALFVALLAFAASEVAINELVVTQAIPGVAFDVTSTISLIVFFGYVLGSGLTLLITLLALVLIAELFNIRHFLAYAIVGGVAALCGYLGFIPVPSGTPQKVIQGIMQSHSTITVGAGVLCGLVFWIIAGRNAGVWRTQLSTPAGLAGS